MGMATDTHTRATSYNHHTASWRITAYTEGHLPASTTSAYCSRVSLWKPKTGLLIQYLRKQVVLCCCHVLSWHSH